jgi:hypothetical protein
MEAGRELMSSRRALNGSLLDRPLPVESVQVSTRAAPRKPCPPWLNRSRSASSPRRSQKIRTPSIDSYMQRDCTNNLLLKPEKRKRHGPFSSQACPTFFTPRSTFPVRSRSFLSQNAKIVSAVFSGASCASGEWVSEREHSNEMKSDRRHEPRERSDRHRGRPRVGTCL